VDKVTWVTPSAADIEDVKSAVLAFGLGDLVKRPTAVAQAWSNAVYRVDTTKGAFAVKLFAPSMPHALLRRLRRGMALERQVLATGLIPMPQPVHRHGEWIVELPDTTTPRFVRCHAWVVGAPASQPLDRALIEQAGTYLGQLHAMHQIAGDTSQLPRLGINRWNRAVESASHNELPFAAELACLTPLVRSLAADLDELRRQRRPMRLSHRDYDPKDTVISDAGQLVVTDWDYAGPVLADVELIVSATSFAERDEAVIDFIQAYRAAGGDAVHADPLAMTAELADLDWLLRNVEAFARSGEHDITADERTVRDLITSLPAEVDKLRGWPERLSKAGEAVPPNRSIGHSP